MWSFNIVKTQRISSNVSIIHAINTEDRRLLLKFHVYTHSWNTVMGTHDRFTLKTVTNQMDHRGNRMEKNNVRRKIKYICNGDVCYNVISDTNEEDDKQQSQSSCNNEILLFTASFAGLLFNLIYTTNHYDAWLNQKIFNFKPGDMFHAIFVPYPLQGDSTSQ